MSEYSSNADAKEPVRQGNGFCGNLYRKIQDMSEPMKSVCVVSALFLLLCASSYGMNSSAELQETTLAKEASSARLPSAMVAIPANDPSAVRTSFPSNAPREDDLSVDESITPVPRTYSLDAEDSRTVYVSRSGKIHLHSSCSGMEYYTETLYSEAVKQGYAECSKCFR